MIKKPQKIQENFIDFLRSSKLHQELNGAGRYDYGSNPEIDCSAQFDENDEEDEEDED